MNFKSLLSLVATSTILGVTLSSCSGSLAGEQELGSEIAYKEAIAAIGEFNYDGIKNYSFEQTSLLKQAEKRITPP